jgi:hypothetical protein
MNAFMGGSQPQVFPHACIYHSGRHERAKEAWAACETAGRVAEIRMGRVGGFQDDVGDDTRFADARRRARDERYSILHDDLLRMLSGSVVLLAATMIL